MGESVAAVVVAADVFKNVVRVPAGDGARYPETHVCDKTLSLLATAKSRNFSALAEGQLGLYLGGFKLKGGDEDTEGQMEDTEGQMRFVAGFRQLLPKHRRSWELQNNVSLDAFVTALLSAVSTLSDNENLQRHHELCSELGTKHSSVAAVISLKDLCLDLAREFAADANVLKVVGYGCEVEACMEVLIHVNKEFDSLPGVQRLSACA